MLFRKVVAQQGPVITLAGDADVRVGLFAGAPPRRVRWRLLRLGGLGLVLALAGFLADTAWASGLDPSVLSKIDAATFEVVAAKPTHDPTTYAKPLPLDLIPYQRRTDKYHSIGTAFALGHNRYVTAGHVLLTGLDSLWGPLELRDSKGHVYAIDKILKFSLRKDFVVFSLVNPPANDVALGVDPKPAVNQAVYAVGNALGTGVVARDGLYTSNTPEDQNGEWKWIRFSAAASPGNSGGPLLDAKGRIIGVVLMKSANENLNYALPIGQVLDAPAHLAVIDRRMPYQFDLIDTTVTGTFKAQFALPLSQSAFYAKYLDLLHAYVDGQLQAVLTKEPDRMFPSGDGSHQMLYHTSIVSPLPLLLKRNSDGVWLPNITHPGKATLSSNGYVLVGFVGKNILFHLRKPDDVTADALFGQPQRLMDMLLQIGLDHRRIASERIKVTSLGKPAAQRTYTDRWQRHWEAWTWAIPYANGRVIVLALPVPDGYVGFARELPAADEHDYLINLEAMTDYFFTSYDGTLAQWKDFLHSSAQLPDAFKSIHIDFDYGKRFSYASQRMAFSFTPKLQKITPDTELTLAFGFYPDHGKAVWDVQDVRVKLSTTDHDFVNVDRNAKPTPDLPDIYQSIWNKIAGHQYPYNGVAQNKDGVMSITDWVPHQSNKDPSVLYTVSCTREGTHSQAEMKSQLDGLLKNVHVHE